MPSDTPTVLHSDVPSIDPSASPSLEPSTMPSDTPISMIEYGSGWVTSSPSYLTPDGHSQVWFARARNFDSDAFNFELGIGTVPPPDATWQDTDDFTWSGSGDTDSFTLVYDSGTNTASLSMGAQQVQFNVAGPFTDIYLQVKAVSQFGSQITIDNMQLDLGTGDILSGTAGTVQASHGGSPEVKYVRIHNLPGWLSDGFTFTGDISPLFSSPIFAEAMAMDVILANDVAFVPSRRRHLMQNSTSIKFTANSATFSQEGHRDQNPQYQQWDPSFDGTLISSILLSNFTGASGPVAFGKEFEKGRNYEGITIGVYNILPHQLNPETGKRSHGAFMISIWNEGDGWENIPGTELIYRDGSNTFPGRYRIIFNEHYITPIVRAIGLGLMLFAWLGAAMLMILISWLRKDPIIQQAQPFYMQIMCIGSIIMSAAIASVAFDEKAGWTNRQLSIACSLTPWFFFTGHILIFCSLFIKMWRVDRVVHYQQRALTVYSALWPLIAFLFVTLSILVAHSAYDPWSWERHIISEIPAETYGKCQSSHTWAFFGPLVGLIFLAEATTLYFAWKTTDIQIDFRDSKAVLYACLAQIQAWAVGAPMLAFLGTSSADATYIARVFLVWIFAVSGVAIVVGPKIVKAIKIRHNPHVQKRVSIGGIFHSSVGDFDEASQSKYGYQDQSLSFGMYGNSQKARRSCSKEVKRLPLKSMISVADLQKIQEEFSSSIQMEEDILDPYTDYIHGERILV